MAVLGRRHWYRYEAGDGNNYKILTLDYLAEAAGLELDDESPELPRGLTPAYIWLQEAEPGRAGRPLRKKLVIQRKDIPRFKPGTTLEVAGIKMIVQSYTGESQRGGRNVSTLSEVRVELSND